MLEFLVFALVVMYLAILYLVGGLHRQQGNFVEYISVANRSFELNEEKCLLLRTEVEKLKLSAAKHE